MKIIKKSPFKLKYQSPLNQNGDNEVVNSAGDDPDLEKFLSGMSTIENPEYSPPEPVQSIEHDYFIKNRSTKTDSVARVFMNLDKEAKALRAAKDPSAGAKQREINELLEYIKNENENRMEL